jgi:hypothetical protein
MRYGRIGTFITQDKSIAAEIDEKKKSIPIITVAIKQTLHFDLIKSLVSLITFESDEYIRFNHT